MELLLDSNTDVFSQHRELIKQVEALCRIRYENASKKFQTKFLDSLKQTKKQLREQQQYLTSLCSIEPQQNGKGYGYSDFQRSHGDRTDEIVCSCALSKKAFVVPFEIQYFFAWLYMKNEKQYYNVQRMKILVDQLKQNTKILLQIEYMNDHPCINLLIFNVLKNFPASRAPLLKRIAEYTPSLQLKKFHFLDYQDADLVRFQSRSYWKNGLVMIKQEILKNLFDQGAFWLWKMHKFVYAAEKLMKPLFDLIKFEKDNKQEGVVFNFFGPNIRSIKCFDMILQSLRIGYQKSFQVITTQIETCSYEANYARIIMMPVDEIGPLSDFTLKTLIQNCQFGCNLSYSNDHPFRRGRVFLLLTEQKMRFPYEFDVLNTIVQYCEVNESSFESLHNEFQIEFLCHYLQLNFYEKVMHQRQKEIHLIFCQMFWALYLFFDEDEVPMHEHYHLCEYALNMHLKRPQVLLQSQMLQRKHCLSLRRRTHIYT